MIVADELYPLDLAALPRDWDAVFIGDAINDIRSGFPCGRHNRDGVGVPHLRPMNIDREGRFDSSELKYVGGNEDSLRALQGDVLFNNTNSPELIGKTGVVTQPGEWAFSNHMTRLRPPIGLNSRFIALQLHFLWMLGYFGRRCTNHVNQASISSSTLAASVPLIVAPTDEQDRIVAEIEKQFTRLDDAVAALKRVQANLKRYRASVLKAACEGRLVPTEAELARKEGRDYEPASELLKRILAERRAKWESEQLAKMTDAGKLLKNNDWKKKYREPAQPDTFNLPGVPEGWTWASAEQVTEFITDGEHITPDRSESGVLLLSARNVQNGNISLEEVDYISEQVYETLCRRLEVAEGDVLLSCSGSVGRSCVVPADMRFALVRSVAVLRPIIVDPEYVSSALRSPFLQEQVREKSTQTAQSNIFQGKIRTLVFPIPPLAEQQRIVAALEHRSSLLNATASETAISMRRTDGLRSSILSRAFSGKLVPQDPSDEPASVLLERIRAERAQQAANKPARKPRTKREKAIAVEA